eukprot:Amastigsp_a1948_5.p4 type:complete len:101 gc:universal Amastigsp_a1948_5:334-636(+)
MFDSRSRRSSSQRLTLNCSMGLAVCGTTPRFARGRPTTGSGTPPVVASTAASESSQRPRARSQKWSVPRRRSRWVGGRRSLSSKSCSPRRWRRGWICRRR